MTYIPPEMTEHILQFSDSSTLKNCIQIKDLTKIAQKILDKRYQRCLKVLIELGMDENTATNQLDNRCIVLSNLEETVTDASIIKLKNCPGLTKIYLLDCSNITDTSVTALAQGCPELMVICLWNITALTDISMRALAKYCPKLR